MKTHDLLFFILGIIGVVIIIFFIYVFCINKGSEESFNIYWSRVFIPLLAAFLLVCYKISLPIESTRKIINFAFIHSENNLISLNNLLLGKDLRIPEGYEIQSRFEHIENFNSDFETLLSITEFVIFNYLHIKYSQHWQMQHDNFSALGGSHLISQTIINPEKQQTEIRKEDILHDYHQENIKKYNYLLNNFFLPYDSKMIIENSLKNEYRKIKIKNSYFDLTIKLFPSGQHQLGISSLAELIKEKNPNRKSYFITNIRIETTCKYKKISRWSNQMERSQEWVNKLLNDMSIDFKWENYENILLRSVCLEKTFKK